MREHAKPASDIRELLAGYPVVIEQAVVWGEMDSYRHVNNVAYFRYLENVRVEYMRRLDWFAFEAQSGIGPILAAVDARFRRPLTFPDTISVAARVATLGKDRFTLEHIIVSYQQAMVVTVGHSTLVTFDYRANQKVAVPQELRERLQKVEGRGL